MNKLSAGNAGPAAWIYRNQSLSFLDSSSNKQNWRCYRCSKSHGLPDWLV